jgi:hypothetical protein
VTALGPQEAATGRVARDGLSRPDSGARLPGHADGDSTHVRVQILTNAGALDRDKQLPVISQLTAIVAAAAGIPRWPTAPGTCSLKPRRRMGPGGDANINAELAQGRPRRDSEPPARTGN